MKTKAAVCYEFGAPLAIEEIDLAPPQAGEVLVKISACAICHSDLTYIDGGWGGRLPQVFGHEACGVVREVGAGVQNARVGDYVLVTLLRSCGYCRYCENGDLHACETRFALDREKRMHNAKGVAVKQGLRTAAFAEYSVVHQSQVVTIPKGLAPAPASLLSCGVITGFGAVCNTAALPASASVAVVGCGGVGLNSVQGAAHCGAHPLIAIDIFDDKLKAACAFGATHVINSAKQDARKALDEITTATGGKLSGGVDYVFTVVGNAKAIEQGLSLLAPTGTLTIVGMPPDGQLMELDATAVAGASQRILGSKMGSTRLRVDIPKLVDLYQDGRLKLDELVSNRYPLAQINHAIDEVRKDKVIRNVVVF